MHVRGKAKMLLQDAANNGRCWSPVLFIVDVHICRIYLPLIKKHDTQVSCVSDDAMRHCNLCIHSHDAGVPSHVHILRLPSRVHLSAIICFCISLSVLGGFSGADLKDPNALCGFGSKAGVYQI
jgi:hypothetical protein